jgi:hypothetical protein
MKILFLVLKKQFSMFTVKGKAKPRRLSDDIGSLQYYRPELCFLLLFALCPMIIEQLDKLAIHSMTKVSVNSFL